MVAAPTTSTPHPSPRRLAAVPSRRRRHLVAAVTSLAVALGAGACGSDPGTSTAPSVTASSGSPSSTTGTAPGTTSKGTTPKGTTPGTTTRGTTPLGTAPEAELPTADGGGVNREIEAALEVGDVTWSLNPSAYRDEPGVRFGFVCPPGGTAGSVWGTTKYTDDSSVCTAAVHHGLITFEGGGRVVIEMRGGLREYKGSEANGVTSLDYGEWPATFIFPGRAAPEAP